MTTRPATPETTNYVCRICGRMRPLENLLTAKEIRHQPRTRRIRCTGRCGGRKTEHMSATTPDFQGAASW